MGRLARFIRFYTDEDDGEPVPPPVWDSVAGNPVSFNAITPFLLKQLKIAFSPVQDLHGYDSPWPAGGGKNKLNLDRTLGTLADTSWHPSSRVMDMEHYFVNLTRDNYYADDRVADISVTPTAVSLTSTGGGFGLIFPVAVDENTQYTFSATFSNSFVGFGYYDENWTYLSCSSQFSDTVTITTPASCAYCAVCFFTTVNVAGSISYPQFEKGRTATSYAPYANECPISGWTGVNVWQTGVNMWDEEWEVGGILNNTGQNVNTVTDAIRSKNYTPVTAGTNYCCVNGSKNVAVIFFYKSDYTFISNASPSLSSGYATFTTPAECAYMRFKLTNQYGTTYKNDCAINYPSTDTEYHAYDPASQLIPVVFPDGETYYSGWADPTTGDGIADMAGVDLGTLTWTLYVLGNGDHLFRSSNLPNFVGVNRGTDFLCDRYKTVDANQRTNGTISQTLLRVVDVIDNSYETAADFKTAMNGAQLVYKVDEPTPIQLTPQEVTSLLGDNVVWSDANGDLTITYRSN